MALTSFHALPFWKDEATPPPQIKVVSHTTSNESSNTKTHTVRLPDDIASGEIVFVVFANDDDDATDEPTGWTRAITEQSGGDVRLSFYYRVADGTEGTTLTVTTAGAEESVHAAFRIQNYQGTPESTNTTGSSSAPDSPSLTPSWGSAVNLWFSVAAIEDADGFDGYPSGFTSTLEVKASDVSMAVAWRVHENTVLDPSAFSYDDSESWVAATIALQTV